MLWILDRLCVFTVCGMHLNDNLVCDNRNFSPVEESLFHTVGCVNDGILEVLVESSWSSLISGESVRVMLSWSNVAVRFCRWWWRTSVSVTSIWCDHVRVFVSWCCLFSVWCLCVVVSFLLLLYRRIRSESILSEVFVKSSDCSPCLSNKFGRISILDIWG